MNENPYRSPQSPSAPVRVGRHRKPLWGFFAAVLLGYLVAFIAGDLLGIPPFIAIEGDRFRSELDGSGIFGALLGLIGYWLWWRRD